LYTAEPRLFHSPGVVVVATDDDQVGCARRVYESVLVVDAPGPVAGQVGLQRFGLADSLERRTQCVLDEKVDPFQERSLMLLEPEVILPGRQDEAALTCRRVIADARQ